MYRVEASPETTSVLSSIASAAMSAITWVIELICSIGAAFSSNKSSMEERKVDIEAPAPSTSVSRSSSRASLSDSTGFSSVSPSISRASSTSSAPSLNPCEPMDHETWLGSLKAGSERRMEALEEGTKEITDLDPDLAKRVQLKAETMCGHMEREIAKLKDQREITGREFQILQTFIEGHEEFYLKYKSTIEASLDHRLRKPLGHQTDRTYGKLLSTLKALSERLKLV